jgi:hypothetical protein
MMGMIWAHKYWSARGMSGHESVGPPRGMFYPSSADTLTCVKSLATMFESVVSPYLNDS